MALRVLVSHANSRSMEKRPDPFDGHPVKKSSLARDLGITHGAISQWRRVPAERVVDVERITGISRHTLRPDVFGPAPKQTEAA
jgi:hypothetical protein